MQRAARQRAWTIAGGVQRVVAKSPDDSLQIEMIGAHLKEIADRFRRGDFSEPALVHGAAMPGLAELRAAKLGELKTRYHDVPSGAEVEYLSDNPKIIGGVHDWFDAQLAEHSAAAAPGHDHTMSHDE